jgi:hypothetical protein
MTRKIVTAMINFLGHNELKVEEQYSYKMKSILFLVLLAGVGMVECVPVILAPKITAAPLTDGAKKVEKYATELQRDLAFQESSLLAYVSKAERERGSQMGQLRTLTMVLGHLREQLSNTTKYYNQYNAYVSQTEAHLRPLNVEYQRASALYNQTRVKLKEERVFLDTLLTYIRAKKC